MSLVLCAANSKAAIVVSETRCMAADGVTVASECVPKHVQLDPTLIIACAGRTDSMREVFAATSKAYAETGSVENVKDALRKSWKPAPADNGYKFGCFLVSQSLAGIDVLVVDESGAQDCQLSCDEHFLLLNFAPSSQVKELVESTLLPVLEESRNRPQSQFVMTLQPAIYRVFKQAAKCDRRLNSIVKCSILFRCPIFSTATNTK